MKLGIWGLLVGLMAAGTQAQVGQAQTAGSVRMVKAELQKPLDTNKSRTGDLFYLKTSEDWQSVSCTVRARSLIVGEVARLARPGKALRGK